MGKKKQGEIGSNTISFSDAPTTVELRAAQLPTVKESAEELFGRQFVDKFNLDHPLGPNVAIEIVQQNDTSTFDFTIDCSIADHLEVAELTPLQEAWGRRAWVSQAVSVTLDVHEFGSWIYKAIVRRKNQKYNERHGVDVTKRIVLLLYVTRWQFNPSPGVLECLQSWIARDGTDFASIFLLRSNGHEAINIEKVFPIDGGKRPTPSSFKGGKFTNGSPEGLEVNADGSVTLLSPRIAPTK